MKQSLIRKAIILTVSILITSILFFVVTTLTYNSFYVQTILNANENLSARWTSDIDRRLDNIYEHLYDLAATLYQKTEVRPGSPEMDYTIKIELQDAMNHKVLASQDTTVLFLLDTESDLYLYYHNSALVQSVNYNLKLFMKQHCLEHHSSLNNKTWDVLEILEHGYYYKALSMGKYIVGAVSDCRNYSMDPTWIDDDEQISLFIRNDSSTILCQGDPGQKDYADAVAEGSSFQDGYAITADWQNSAKASAILISRPKGAGMPLRIASIFMILDSAICVILVFVLMYYLNQKVRKPIRKLVDANQEVAKGNFDYQLDPDESGSTEFEELFHSFNDMSGKIEKLTIESYDLKIKREQNRLKMLRAQMRPHTFLNGITTISNMTYTSKPEEIRKYISSFASFTRYMLHNAGDWTTVKDELRHIDNYVNMQKIRFPNSIEITYNCSPEVLEEKIPYLTLFSLVENSFKHAMTLVDTMYVEITGEPYEEEGFKGIRLIEEDNGPGFSPEALEKLADLDDLYTKEHLGLTNVHYSMNLIYHRNDLLRLMNKPEGGARIELLIPEEEVEDETAGM
ncbi:MAG: histidine kinase [Solobacterium sp.]|nr:histidine kinase [Solobacterium sp.]